MKKLLLVIGLLGMTMSIHTQEINTDSKGIAIKGYDPVAYFTMGKAVKGSNNISFSYEEAIYYFVNQEHRSLFMKNPENYLPQFGGYCAWAVKEGYIAPIDPEAWTIVDDRLFLNYSKSVKRRFVKDLQENIRKAYSNWPALLADLQ